MSAAIMFASDPSTSPAICDFSVSLTEKVLLFLLLHGTSTVVLLYLFYQTRVLGRRPRKRDAFFVALSYLIAPTLPIAYAGYILLEDVRFLVYKTWKGRSWRFNLHALLGASLQKPDGTIIRLSQTAASDFSTLNCHVQANVTPWIIWILIWAVSGGVFWYPWPWYVSPGYLKDRIDIANHGGKALWFIMLLVLISNCRWEFRDSPAVAARDSVQSVSEEALEKEWARVTTANEEQNELRPSRYKRALSWYESWWKYAELGVYIFIIFTIVGRPGRLSDYTKLYLIAPSQLLAALLVRSQDRIRPVRNVFRCVFLLFWPIVVGVPLVFYTLLTLAASITGRQYKWITRSQRCLVFWRKWFIVPVGIIWFLLFHFIFTWTRVGLAYKMPSQNCDWDEWWLHGAESRWMFCTPCNGG